MLNQFLLVKIISEYIIKKILLCYTLVQDYKEIYGAKLFTWCF